MTDEKYTTQPQPNVMNIITITLTNKEILEVAIQKAIDNGWKGKQYLEDIHAGFFGKGESDYKELIFNHDFAKAIWGEEKDDEIELLIHNYEKIRGQKINVVFPKWKQHLQQMVISDDPIEYLGEHLDG